MDFKIGQSVDIHNLKKRLINGNIFLGLEAIDAPFKIDAYSDGDIIIHVIAEAIIGALGLKDLGTHFPDTNPKNKNISGREILEYTTHLLEKHKYQISNIDCTVVLDNFRLNKYLDIFCKNISLVLKNTTENAINIKATTSEGNFSNIISAHAVVMLKKN